MTVSLEDLARIAEIEFSDIVDSTEMMETKLRIMLTDGGFVDVWLSRKLAGRFGFHWEHKATGRSYRYDNFPNAKWKHVSTYPYHFHYGSQDSVIDSSRFERDITEGFRDFMKWVRSKLSGEEGDDPR
jgi:predicted dehydrogenase